jgi:hypothetical protein
MKFGFLKNDLETRTSSAPNRSSATGKMNMVWWSATRQDLWLRALHKLNSWTLVKHLAYASHHNMKLFQMDVKSAFLNGFINELVFVEQPPGFEHPRYPNHVYRLNKALYGLKQAPWFWYECLRDFLLEKGFTIGRVDTTLFTKVMTTSSSYVKSMLMTLYFVQLTPLCARSLEI